MFKFVILTVLCWIGLCVLGVIFISDQRKKSLSLRSFVKLAKNQSPEKWTIRQCTENSGFYKTDEEPKEYSTQTADFCLKIGKYPRKKIKNNEEITYYSYRMFVSTKGVATIFEDNKKIAKAYYQIDQECKRMEKIIKKWQKSDARIRKVISWFRPSTTV